MSRSIILSLVLFAFSARPIQAQFTLGAILEQGAEGRPVVVQVLAEVRGGRSLASYLELHIGDQIVSAHSDPIPLSDGNHYDSWEIHSTSDLKWVLEKTRSKIGLTVKRGNRFIQSVATYGVVMETATAPCGRIIQVAKGAWSLEGPKEVKDSLPRGKDR
jgi:hypothetical protein